MLLFRSEEHADRWCGQKQLQRGATFSPETAWKLAHAWYGQRMQPNWQRLTLDGAEALLTSIGLTGAFWNLRH
jgi:hypothetical protein